MKKQRSEQKIQMKQKVMLFAGTTEGRLLYEFLEERGIDAGVYVTTAYGEQILSHEKQRLPRTASQPYVQQRLPHTAGQPYVQQQLPCPAREPDSAVHIHTGCLDREGMEEQMKQYAPTLVIDATHPYADAATANIREASGTLHIPYIRVLRASCRDRNEQLMPEGLTEVADIRAAAARLEHTCGNILVTTGSKELQELCGLTGFSERIYARILPISAMLEKCRKLGLTGRHIICMQGPFSEEMNYAMLREVDAAFLLTKESGTAGGYPEKLAAAKRANAAVVVIRRPEAGDGYSVEEVKGILLAKDGNDHG